MSFGAEVNLRSLYVTDGKITNIVKAETRLIASLRFPVKMDFFRLLIYTGIV